MVPCRPFRLVEHRNTTQEYPATVMIPFSTYGASSHDCFAPNPTIMRCDSSTLDVCNRLPIHKYYSNAPTTSLRTFQQTPPVSSYPPATRIALYGNFPE